MKRAVITGLGAATPLGYSVPELMEGLLAGRCATRRMEAWSRLAGLKSLVAAPLEPRDGRDIPRLFRRTMSPMSIFAAHASKQALEDAGIAPDSVGGDPRVGCIFGHTTGSPQTITATYESLALHKDLALLSSSDFFRCLSHTVVVNVAQYLGISGTVMATSAACASGLQAAGAAFDLVRMGRQELVICGGSEELHPIVTGSFDILYATSSAYNDRPQLTPRPFDRDRDGLVCGEGAGVLVVEEHDRAVKRGAHIYGEILGYDTRGNGSHMSQSDRKTMALSMQAALAEARLAPTEVGYVNAHATGTLQGDAAEAQAINDIFGQKVPVSSLKGHLGHTLGASGPIELIACLKMMQQKIILPTKHLENIAEDCNCIQHVLEIREQPFRRFLKNSFAFGGINAAMVIAAI